MSPLKTYGNNLPGLYLIHSGKVRDTYDIGQGRLLMVASDRVSTHNIPHESLIPGKGYILTLLVVLWMYYWLDGIPTHLVAFGKQIYRYLPKGEYPPDLHLRAIIVRKLWFMAPFEFIERDYLAGSLYNDYYSKGRRNPYGIHLPMGMQLMSRFPSPVFTPTLKSETDPPFNSKRLEAALPLHCALAHKVYAQGKVKALQRGIQIIDTKLEVGMSRGGRVTLADECLTPDSSRFVAAGTIEEGKEPAWLDKQVLRDEAKRRWQGHKSKFPLTFSDEAIRLTVGRYHNLFEMLSGQSLQRMQRDYLEG